MLQILNDNGIEIGRSRMDAGSYSKAIVEVVEKYSDRFYIRANRCDFLTNVLLEKTVKWTKEEINSV